MKATRILGLALTTGLAATLGCAQTAPTITPAPEPAAAPATTLALPQLQTMTEGTIAPDNLLVDNQQTMVNGQAMSVEEIRKLLPSRISEADAAKMLVKIDLDKVNQSAEFDTQQRFGRGFGRGFVGRGFGRGFVGRGFGRGFFGRGIYGGWGFRNRFFNRGFFGGLGFLPYSSYYFPYYYNAGYYYPYTYSFANTLCSPYLYGWGGSFWPYTWGWGGMGGLGGWGGWGW